MDVNDSIAQSEAFVIKHKKSLISALVAVVVIVGGILLFKFAYLNPRGEKASALLALGQNYFVSNDFEKALNGDGSTFPGYVKIAKDYSMTDAGNLANMYAGICYAKTGKVKEAINYLEDFSPKGDATISPAALGTLANLYATNNQVDKAIETFKKAAKKADNPSLSPIFLISAGELLESQKKYSDAVEVYQEVKDKYPTSIQAAPQQQNGKIISPEIDKYIERASVSAGK